MFAFAQIIKGKFLNPLLLLLLACPVFAGNGDGISDKEIADIAQRAMAQFDAPGMSIGIVRGGQTLYARGHGIREQGHPEPVDADTMFKIASNTKAFTTAALAILVDEEKLSWDAAVIDYIPEFRMSDPWVTVEFTVTDLLTHRSGLRRFVGDLMLWPEPNSFTEADIIRGLKHFELVSGFRTEYAYDNLLYIVAGEIIPRVTGQAWGQFVDKRIMKPLGMKRCFAGPIPKRKMKNIAAPHGMVEGKMLVIERSRIGVKPPVSAAAGGIVCSLSDMLIWVKTQLGKGTSPTGVEVFSSERNQELWRPETWRGVSDRDYELHETHFSAYGLGWRLRDVHGYKEVSHTGSLAGMLSYVVLVPELNLGVVLLSNGSNSDARSAVMSTIVRSFMPVEQRDWIETYKEFTRLKREKQQALEKVVETVSTSGEDVPDLKKYKGRYRDQWFGDVTINEQGGRLTFAAEKSPKLSGPISFLSDNMFIVRWTDRTVEMDAFIWFEYNDAGEVMSMFMNREFPLQERGLDFEDLKLSKIK